MSIVSDYTFNRTDRIGLDVTDNTQRNMQNTRYSNYYTTNNFSESSISANTIRFGSAYPTMVMHNTAIRRLPSKKPPWPDGCAAAVTVATRTDNFL